MSSGASRALTSALLTRLREWWFEGMKPAEVATDDSMKLFFSKIASTPENDAKCRDEFSVALGDAVQMNQEELMDLARNKEDAISLVILLDQIPRNIFRGDLAKSAYTVSDPISLSLVKKFTHPPYDYDAVSKWDNISYCMMMWLPYMHSEDLASHDILAAKLAVAKSECKHAFDQKLLSRQVSYAEKHRAVLEKYGRYPSRNAALGRVSTQEEIGFIVNGPGW